MSSKVREIEPCAKCSGAGEIFGKFQILSDALGSGEITCSTCMQTVRVASVGISVCLRLWNDTQIRERAKTKCARKCCTSERVRTLSIAVVENGDGSDLVYLCEECYNTVSPFLSRCYAVDNDKLAVEVGKLFIDMPFASREKRDERGA